MNIQWNCDTCHQPIHAKQGWITINYGDIRNYEEGKAAWEAEHQDWAYPLSAWDTYPETPHWHVWHKDCDPDIDSMDYTIDIERIRTKGHMLSWTAHLLSKYWFPSTNWDDIIRRALTPKELNV